MASIKDQLYIYSSPFLIEDTPSNRERLLFDYFNEFEREDEQKIRAIMLKYATQAKLLIAQEERLVGSDTDNMGSWVWHMNHMNFRSLIDMQQYHDFMSSMRAEDGKAINFVIELHGLLGMMFDVRLLNTLVHRTITSVQQIPYGPEPGNEVTTWERIHRETPFMWVMILMQALLRSSISKTV